MSSDGTNLIISDAVEAFSSAPAGWTLGPGGSSIQRPLAGFVGSVTINGAGGDDTLTIDLSGGDVIPVGGLFFHGGAGGNDTLAFVGSGIGNATLTHVNANDGSLNIDGNSLVYTGLDPILINTPGANWVLEYVTAAAPVTLAAVGADLQVTRSGAAEEVTISPAGLASLTIRTGSGADTIELDSLPAGWSAGITIDGQGGADILNVDTALITTSGALTLQGIETANLNYNITASTLSGDVATVNVANAPSGQIQDGVDVAANGATVNVAAGTYTENVAIPTGKNGLTALGANAGISANPIHAETRVAESIIVGAVTIGGSQGVVGVTFDGFEVQSNTSSGIFVRGLNLIVANNIIQGQAVIPISGTSAGIGIASTAPETPQSFAFTNNYISGYRYGLLIDGSATTYDASGVSSVASGNYITNNERAIQSFGNVHGGSIVHQLANNTIVDNNRGIRLAGGQFTITGNVIANNNATGGAGGGYGIYAGVAASPLNALTITNNFITDNPLAGVILEGAAGIPVVFNNSITGSPTLVATSGAVGPANASGNWWGTISAAAIAGLMTGAVDFTPYLASSTDTSLVAPGFQGDFDELYVTTLGAQVGGTGRIQEGINLANSGGTVRILSGSYAGNVDAASKPITLAPGASPGQVTINGDLTLDANDTLAIEIDGTNPVTDYDNFLVNGAVTLGGATLTVTGSYVPAALDSFTLISNDLADSVTGTFNGLPPGTVVNVNGADKRIFYTGNDGNDVVLTSETPTTAYVSNTLWTGYVTGQFIPDADAGTNLDQPAIFGYNAFETIAAAQSAITASGTIIVNAGTYNVAVVGSGTQTIEITGLNTQQNSTFSSLATVAGQNVIIEGTSILTIGNAANTTIAGVISGSGALTKTGAGTVILSGANTYGGTTTINQGTLALSGGNNRLPTANDIVFGVTSTLDIGSTSQAIRNLIFNATATGTTNITGSGGELVSNASANLVIGGNADGVTRTVNMSGLSNFTFNGAARAFSVGGVYDVNGASPSGGTLLLAQTSNITAISFNVGTGSNGFSYQNTGTVRLGQTTVLNSNTIIVGGEKNVAALNYQAGLINPALTIRGTSGGATSANITVSTNSSGVRPTTGTLDLTTGITGSLLDARVGTLLIGMNGRTSSGAQSSTGSISVGGGTLTATSIILGRNTSGGSGGGVATGSLSINGATVNATTVTLADRVSVVGVTSNLTLISGTLNAGTIQRGSSAGGGGTINFTWIDGTISNPTGLNQSVNGVTPVSGLTGGLTIALSNTGNLSGTHTWNVSGSNSATVNSNVTLTSVGSLTKMGTGTLELVGVNTYTGATTVNLGTLAINGSVTSNVTVNAAGTLIGNGTVTGNVNGAGTFSPGNSPGTMTIVGSFTPSGTVNFEVNSPWTAAGTDYDR